MGCALSSNLQNPSDLREAVRVQGVGNSSLRSRVNLEAKVVLLGDSGVGKSSLALRFCRGRFPRYHEVTIGAAFLQQTLKVRDARDGGEDAFVKLFIWDTGGQERFRSMAPLYYRDAAGAVIVYDVASPSSLEAVQFWAEELQQRLASCVIVVAANKADLLSNAVDAAAPESNDEESSANALLTDSQRQEARAAMEGVRRFCDEKNFGFVECSAKTGLNVGPLFESLAQSVFVNMQNASLQDS